MKQQCIDAVETAIGRKLKANESKDIEANIKKAMIDLARQDVNRWRNLSDYEKTLEASQHVGKMLEADVKRKNKIAAMDIIKQNKNLETILNHPKLPSMEALDRMIAFHGDMSGIQSVSAKAKAITSLYKGQLHELYSKVDGSLGLIQDKKFVKDFVKEAFGENSTNPVAKKLAAEFSDVATNLRERFNRNGGSIGVVDNWGLWTSWSPGKALDNGLDKWLELSLKNFDRKKAVHEDGRAFSEDELIDLLTAAYKTIKSDGANKIEVGKPNYTGNSKVTNRHSESRVLHWKDADAWMEMQNEFGDMPLIDIIDSNIDRMSKEIALIETFGSNPKMAVKILKDAARKKDKDERSIESSKVDKVSSRIDDMFDEFTGSVTGNAFWANVGLAYRSINVASMLGGTTLTSFTDQAMIAKTASVHNIAYHKVFGEMLSQLNPKNKADREHAYYMGIGVDELSGAVSRWSDDGLTSIHGRAAKIARGSNNVANQVLKFSFLHALTRASKSAFDTVLMAKYGDMTRNKSWADLHSNDKALLEGTGLNERAWEVMRVAEPNVDRKGRNLMSARAIYAIPDDKLLAAMDGDVRALVDDIDSQIKELDSRNAFDDQRMANRGQKVDDIKRQLSQRLLDYANRKDTKSQAEKQALQDRIDLIDAQKEATAAQADMNAYLRNVENSENLKGFMDGITQGKTIDNLTDKAKKLGRTLESLDNKVVLKTTKLNDKIKTFEKEIQGKFTDFKDLLGGKSKLSKEKLAEYEDRLSERLNSYASRRDVNTQKELDALSELKELVALKQEHLDTNFEITKAKEQTRIKGKTDSKIDSSVSQNARRNYKSGEDLGYRLGNSERRIIELRGKMRSADSAANKAITQKFKDLDKRVNELDAEFIDYQTKVAERQSKRDHVSKRLANSITDEKKALAQKIRDEVATQFQAHLLDEQGMAVIEAGLRERTKFTGGTKRGTLAGEFVRLTTQFKSFPLSFLMRHGSRTMSRDGWASKAWYAGSLLAMTTILGGLVVQLKGLSSGDDPSEMWDGEKWYTAGINTDFLKRSFVAGGGLPILGDILIAGTDLSGRDAGNFLAGPFGSDFKTALSLTVGNTTQAASGVDTNFGNEAFKAAKSKLPAQNLWYTKAVANRLIFDNFQDMIAPGYREKLLRKAEQKYDRTRWLGDFDWGEGFEEVDTPDIGKTIRQ